MRLAIGRPRAARAFLHRPVRFGSHAFDVAETTDAQIELVRICLRTQAAVQKPHAERHFGATPHGL